MKKGFNIKSSLNEIPSVVNEIIDALRQEGVKNGLLHDVKLSTEEAVINAIKHGNKFRQELTVTINFEYSKNRVMVSVQDEGEGYDYKKIPDPTLNENISKGCGRGVFLIRRLMDEVHFNNSGNRIKMVKYVRRYYE